MRLIDADALFEKIQLMIGTGVIYGAEAEAIERMLHEVEHAPTVPQFGEWILKEPPKDDNPVLAVIDGKKRTAVFDGENWWGYPNGEDLPNATSWMPLPEPPKGEDK